MSQSDAAAKDAGAADAPIRSTLDGDGVLLATIDMPGRTMNVFSVELMDALDALMDRAETDPRVESVVVTSAKPTFLAGADLVMVRGYTEQAKSDTHAQMFDRCGRLGRQFVRLEASAKPWVAAVNGIALGGGLELALACRARLVTNDARTQLGVPEVRWGLLPGAGGTQRLPRLAGFEPAMDLLLSGRSIAPLDAVRLGIFARTVPAATLVDAAKELARTMHGEPYDAKAKFARLGQADVPPYDAATARAVAQQHAIGAEAFGLYPAYSAIVDSVLKGARLPLAEATTVEMNQFLRLMFDPVAGRMVRTLFLQRLRAERELAGRNDVRLERIGVGAVSEARRAWSEALTRLKLPQASDRNLPGDTLALIDAQGQQRRVALQVLDDDADFGGEVPFPFAVLSPAGPYGRVLEIVGASDADAAALAALAARLGSLPWRTPGPTSLLQRLRGRSLEEQAKLALRFAAQPNAGDPAFVDVAACLSGVTPAWTGGPLTWLWAQQKSQLASFDGATSAAWTLLEPALAQACA
ncbi:MAG TPA: enoyl-CoA hydratase-related protein [Caldimonas sp.]|jgi:3-hydroxyacyl-CoA dehydrogenase/enoyl-CoA hydratase/3-hydroxybutyryl-CoA epimerase|nr:enoyl-CoA hydratase-related protein [Caldimonas sp.]HEV7575241.1 enoyl-CoA hydratase-related protein [Caldimonas sp.]